MKTKYLATIVGVVISALFFGIWVEPFMLVSMGMSIGSLLPSVLLIELPLEQIFEKGDYFSITLTTLIIEVVLLLLLCYRYFRKLVLTKRENKPFNFGKLILFFFFLQFLIHPIGFNIWALPNIDYARDSMFIFSIIETTPYSGLTFILLGIIIDLVRGQKPVDFN